MLFPTALSLSSPVLLPLPPSRAPNSHLAIPPISISLRLRLPPLEVILTGLARIARLGPAFGLRIPISGLSVACELGQARCDFVWQALVANLAAAICF